MLDQLNAAINTQEIRIANLESRLSGNVIPTGDDGYIVDKINYHLGVAAGLRQARLMLQMEDV